jgi:hypothetical protein
MAINSGCSGGLNRAQNPRVSSPEKEIMKQQ